MSETMVSRKFRLRSPAPGIRAWFNDKFSVAMPLDRWRHELAPGHKVTVMVPDDEEESLLLPLPAEVADVVTGFHREPVVVALVSADGKFTEREIPVHRVYPRAKP